MAQFTLARFAVNRSLHASRRSDLWHSFETDADPAEGVATDQEILATRAAVLANRHDHPAPAAEAVEDRRRP